MRKKAAFGRSFFYSYKNFSLNNFPILTIKFDNFLTFSRFIVFFVRNKPHQSFSLRILYKKCLAFFDTMG